MKAIKQRSNQSFMVNLAINYRDKVENYVESVYFKENKFIDCD